MTDQRAARGELIRHLRNALVIADELADRKTGHLIEQALDQAQSQKGDHAGNLSAPPSTACCLRASENPRPLRRMIFRGSITHPMQSLCTLRSHRRR